MIKKIVCILFSATIIFLNLSGCSSEIRTEGVVPKIKIGVLLYKQDDTFISTIFNNFEKIAKKKEQENNIKITINAVDGKGNQTSQNEQVDKLIEQGYDVLCVNIVDRTAASTIIDKVKAANIPVIFFNREPVEEDLERWDKVYYVGAVASDSGIMQGQIVADAYKKDSASVDKNGDGIIQYVMLEGEQGHQDAFIRTEFCVKAVTSEGIKVERLANDTANWQRAQANTKMTQWIDEFGSRIEVVFSNNDDMALGGIDAYNDAKIEDLPAFVGVDCTPPAIEAIKSGQLLGSVKSDAQGQAEAMFNLCYSLAFDLEVDAGVRLIRNKYVRLPYYSVTKDNVNEIIIETEE